MKRQTRQVYTVSFHLTLSCWDTYQRRWWASGFKLVGLAPPTLLPNHQHSPPHTPFVSLHLLTSNCAGQLQMTPRLKSLTFDGGCVWCRQNKAQHLSFSDCSAAAVWSSRTVREVGSDQLLLPSSLGGKKSILKNCGSKPEFVFSQRNGNILAKHFPAHTQIYLWMREFTQSDLQFIQSDSIISWFRNIFCVILCHFFVQ